jgi:hypothetical protein
MLTWWVGLTFDLTAKTGLQYQPWPRDPRQEERRFCQILAEGIEDWLNRIKTTDDCTLL